MKVKASMYAINNLLLLADSVDKSHVDSMLSALADVDVRETSRHDFVRGGVLEIGLSSQNKWNGRICYAPEGANSDIDGSIVYAMLPHRHLLVTPGFLFGQFAGGEAIQKVLETYNFPGIIASESKDRADFEANYATFASRYGIRDQTEREGRMAHGLALATTPLLWL